MTFNRAQITQIKGNLSIQNIPMDQPGGSVCNTLVKGNVIVQNNKNQSAIEIGDPDQTQNCPANSVETLVCKGNAIKPISSLTSGKNQCSS